uniref:Phosphatidylinositol glycan, class C n=3 Tax=Macrostomum lignano TaxID=282301 RepID=A0A1I8ITZ1_9PLAT
MHSGSISHRKCLHKPSWPERPDNFTGDDFLEDLKRNLYVKRHSLLTVVVATGRVFQHFCSLCLFVQAYCLMLQGTLAPETVLFGLGMLAPPLYLAYLFCASGSADKSDLSPMRTAFGHCRLLLVLTAFTLMWSPLLKSLTATISTDTIHAMTAFFLTANLLFHDYGGSAAIVSKSFSLNSAVFAAICLASRLPSSLHTFTTVELALFVFAFWPELRRNMSVGLHSPFQPVLSLGLTFLLNLAAQCAMCFISMPAACCFLLLSCFIMLICPIMFVAMQAQKNNIHGPWDEAVIH